jgi:Golgi phosphoprotein 3 (GPP34)
MLLAEDLLLLVTDDATGRLSVSGEPVDAGLGGASLVELTLRGQVDVSGGQDPGRRGRIIVRTLRRPGTRFSTPPCRPWSSGRAASRPP